VLDYGTGSGVLAVAALLLGARRAAGVDVDPLSVLAARRNADLNAVCPRFDVVHCEASLEVRRRRVVDRQTGETGAQLATFDVVLSEESLGAYDGRTDRQMHSHLAGWTEGRTDRQMHGDKARKEVRQLA
jgi:Ribosomal protein L11 methyltransferase (PrmA)